MSVAEPIFGKVTMSQSLDRGLRILDEIVAGRTTLAEISESIGVHKSTVSRLLATLERQHFVYRSDDFQFHIGRKVFDLAHHTIEHPNIRAVALPLMNALSSRTRCPSFLARAEQGQAVVLAVVGSEYSARGEDAASPIRVGDKLSMQSHAVGQVLSAPDMSGPSSFVHDEGSVTSTVAAPVRGFDASVVAAIALVLPKSQTAVQLRPYLAELLHSADEASRALGWRAD